MTSRIAVAAMALLLLGSFTRSSAGTSPETTLLAVNADSPLSLTVANLWMELRPIPQRHVVWLHDIPTLETISMEGFRNRILQPIQNFLKKEELEGEIDTIVYSADFPFAVNIQKVLKKNGIRDHHYIGKSGALTGLTFFTNEVLAGRADFIKSVSNHYFRRPLDIVRRQQSFLPREARKKRDRVRKLLRKGAPSQARKLVEQLLQKYTTIPQLYVLQAEVLAMAGQEQAAMEALESAYKSGWNNSLVLRNDKWLASLKKREDFRELMQRIDTPRSRFESPRGFRNRYHWSRSGIPGTTDLDRYYLSALLAYTGQRGNSLPEIQNYLSRAARSDGSHPAGTVYLMENRDVRTETRQPWFAETCALLTSIGHRCRILTRGKDGEDGILPKKRRDIIGLAAGTRTFNWKRSGSRLLPGAYADSFTSYAGDFDNESQTKLTEFLRHGAAGSSGAVVEPYSFAEKFPLPLIHYYYGLGYSLGESWYMSVASPYQNILVGDPLAQPYADPTRLRLVSPDPDQPWRGKVQIQLNEKRPGSQSTDHYELWVDGHAVASSSTGQSLTWDTTRVADGYHEIHLVAVEPPPREGRSSRRYWIQVKNGNRIATLSAPFSEAAYGTPFFLEGMAPAGSRVRILQGTRELLSFTTKNDTWETILPSSPLGLGKVTIQAEVDTPDGETVISNPLILAITRGHHSRARSSLFQSQEGLLARVITSNEKGDLQIKKKKVPALNGKLKWLVSKGDKLEQVTFSGQFLVDTRGFHQLAIHTRGTIEIEVDDRKFQRTVPGNDYGMVYVPLFLAKGWHNLQLHPQPSGVEKLEVVLAGEQTPTILGGKRTRSSKL